MSGTTDDGGRSTSPSVERPILELTWKVTSTHRKRLNLDHWGEDFADWFDLRDENGDQAVAPSAEQVHIALVEARHLPEMFRDHLIQDADENNGIDWNMDDDDLDIAWVARRAPRGGTS